MILGNDRDKNALNKYQSLTPLGQQLRDKSGVRGSMKSQMQAPNQYQEQLPTPDREPYPE